MRRDYAKTIGCAALLFALNAGITPLLFHTAYTTQMGSIEAAFISLARYVSQHWSDLGWFPLWYGGIPYPDSYPPLLHWVVGLVITLSGASPGLAYHFVTAMVYSLGPVTLFWMAWRLYGSRECALFAGIGYSLISPSCFLAQSVRVSSDGFLGAHRLVTLVLWGEGPHLTSMCLLSLAIGMLHVAFEKRKPWYWAAAVVSVAAVPMSNWLGGMALAIGMLAYVFAGFPVGRKTGATLLRMGTVGVFAYALVMPWLSPATIAVIRANAPRVSNSFQFDATQRIFAAALAAAFLAAAWAMARWKVARHIRFAVLASLVTGASSLGSYWFKLSLLPQPDRYHLEMDMFFWLTAAFAMWPLVRRLVRRLPARLPAPLPGQLRLRPSFVLAVVLAMAFVPVVKKQRRTARWEERRADIGTTIEYKTARWLDAHMPGARVFAPGTIGFWLNAFSDAPQITGGFDNGIRNPFVPDMIFHVYAGADPAPMVALLKAYGCDAMIGGGKDSTEWYHPISHVEKLRGLTELWRDGGDVVYNIPRPSRSLAHVMRSADLMVRPLSRNGWSALDPYLAALENPDYPPAAFRWRAPSAASITTRMEPEQVLSVQIAWDQGWNVTVGRRRVTTWSDKLGQMVVEPRCSGPCTVELKYDGGTEGIYARAVHRTALTGGGLWIVVAILWRKRSGLTKTN